MGQDWLGKKMDTGRSRLSDWSGAVPDADLNKKITGMAALLAEAFTERRSPIALWGENSLDYLVALFAILRAGHIAVPVNTRLTPRELAAVAETVQLRGLLGARDFPQPHRDALPKLSIFSLVQKVDMQAPPPRVKELSDSEPAVMVCSSGSAGRVKVVPLTLQSLFEHAAAVSAHLSVTWHDSWVACLPFYHVGGLAIPFRCLSSGAALIISRTADPEELNRLIDIEGATLVSVVPTVLERMLNTRENAPYPKTLRGIITGGGPVPDRLIERCEQVYPTYGLTEAGSMVTCARPGCKIEERKSAGPPLPKTAVKIADDAGRELKAGQTGQILVRGPGMAFAYIADREASLKTFKGGWIATGDVGNLDTGGFLHVQARRSDVVLSGGENIYPAEIEAALRKHPRVAAAVVLPVEDPEWGQAAAALIALTPGRPLQKIHIFQFLEEHLARYKFPRQIVFAENIPLLANGKPDLIAIRKLLAAK